MKWDEKWGESGDDEKGEAGTARKMRNSYNVFYSAKSTTLCVQAVQLSTVDTDHTCTWTLSINAGFSSLLQSPFYQYHSSDSHFHGNCRDGRTSPCGRTTRVLARIHPAEVTLSRRLSQTSGALISNCPLSLTSASRGKPAKAEILLHTQSTTQEPSVWKKSITNTNLQPELAPETSLLSAKAHQQGAERKKLDD